MDTKRIFGWLNSLWGGWFIRLAIAGCYGIAFAYFLLVALMLWRGDVWAYIVYAENPYAHLAGGLVFLLLAHILKVGDSRPARYWKLLAGKCVMMLISLSVAFAIGEIGLRAILIQQQKAGSMERLRELKAANQKIPIHSDHPMAAIIELSANRDLVYELQPNLAMDFGHKRLVTNSRGMRADREFADDKPPGTLRIIGIGDSGMFGWGVAQGEDYMSVLEKELNKRNDGIKYEVINMGVPGYNTALEVESFVYKGLALHPDIVIVGWCENDYQLPFFMLEAENFHRRDISFLHMYLFRRKDIADVVAGRKLRSMRDVNKDMVESNIVENSGFGGVREALERLKALGNERGFHVLVMGPIKSHVAGIIKDLDLPTFNTYDKINAADYPKEYAIHFMHPRPGGHAVIAEKLAEDLAQRGWLSLGSASGSNVSP